METNWAGTYAYRAPQIARPATIAEVREIVADAALGGVPVHALGTRHSFTDLPDTTGVLVDMTGLPADFSLDEEQRTVTVAAGIRYGELALWLDERGWALPNMGSLPHINVGGATATGTHGSGDANRVLSASVRALRWVGADADLHDVRRGDADFDALAVGLGAYGVTVAVTLDVVPAYRVRQDLYVGVSWKAALADYAAITGAGYSVSVFTRWEEPSTGYVWVKTRLDDDSHAVPATLLDGVQAGAGDSPLVGENITEIGGVPGPWMLRLPHFRLDTEPSFGDEIQSEYFVSRTDAPAALAVVRDAFTDEMRSHLIVSELRSAAADDLLLSGAYQRDSVVIHFTWYNHPDAVAAAVEVVEAALAPFAARPHWGKLHRYDAAGIAAVHPRIADARAVFERLDPTGMFSNAHLERIGVRATRV